MTPGSGRVRLADVAEAADVSVATVSRCLHVPDQVNAATRERVLGVVQRLGYAPDLAARALRTGHSRVIGAVVPTLENSIFARGLQAFQDELSAHGTTMLLASSNYDPEEEFRQIRALAAQGIRGLMLIGGSRSPDVYAMLAQYRIPHVIAWGVGAGDQPYVGFDNHAAAKSMAEAVIAAGHHNIAMVAGQSVGNDRAAARIDGVREALRAADRPPLVVEEAAYSFDAAGAALDRLLSRTPKPDAVICGNDVQGVGVLRRAADLGIAVPEELVVTGFDDIDLAQVVTPSLTTVHVPHRRMGQLCAQALMEGNSGRQTIQTEIVWRASFPRPRGV
ncbi:LacI family DNA-binding transcriptional regulator [Rhizobiaceae bacterium]|nr:LacI family DNA-binding transcriptional regulator [Rhizobiaceae bacterium]